MAETKLEIVNRGLQRIGARRLASLVENSRERLEVDAVYNPIVRQELMGHRWTFAIKRALIMVDGTPPVFGKSFRYALPEDYLRMAPRDPTEMTFAKDSLVESGFILTNFGGDLNLRYVFDVTTLPDPEAEFHPLFANAVSMRLAMELAETLTQSGSKLDRVERAYTFYINLARRIDAIEQGPIMSEIDETVAVRLSDAADATLRPFA